MGVPPSEARKLTWFEYQGMLAQHNLRTDPDGEHTPVAPISADEAQSMDSHFKARFGEVMH